MRGIAICTYNRAKNLDVVLNETIKNAPKDAKIVVCDDGSTDNTIEVCDAYNVPVFRGQNKGVAANKNRALFLLQDCKFLAILEDDLYPIRNNWFESYEKAVLYTGIHHFCRVQDKRVEETVPEFTADLYENEMVPIYGPSPRGDFTFITQHVLRTVGAFDPEFIGAGYAHGFWSKRVAKAGLIPHPLKWVDIRGQDGKDFFKQIGDTEGGRWDLSKTELDKQLRRNRRVLRMLEKKDQIFRELTL